MDHPHRLHQRRKFSFQRGPNSIERPSNESSKRGVALADFLVVASLFALTALLVHLATPTVPSSPQRHASPPVDSGGAVVAAVNPGSRLALYSRPKGNPVGVLSSRTVYGGPLKLPVVRTRGDWLGVLTAAMPNGRLGWVKAEPGALTFGRVRLELEADLSRQVLRVWSHAALGPYYGCCLLALSGNQPHPPPGWTGGARLAIHGGAYGAVSAGCLHASTADLRYLMRVVRLGTQIVIHA